MKIWLFFGVISRIVYKPKSEESKISAVSAHLSKTSNWNQIATDIYSVLCILHEHLQSWTKLIIPIIKMIPASETDLLLSLWVWLCHSFFGSNLPQLFRLTQYYMPFLVKPFPHIWPIKHHQEMRWTTCNTHNMTLGNGAAQLGSTFYYIHRRSHLHLVKHYAKKEPQNRKMQAWQLKAIKAENLQCDILSNTLCAVRKP